MAPKKRKSDDMNVVAPVKNEKSTRSGGNDSIISDHYQNILNNRQSIPEFTEKLFGDGICNMRAQPKQKTVTRVPRGKNADIQPPLGRKSERIATKTEDVLMQIDNANIVSVFALKIRFILVCMETKSFIEKKI